MTEGELLKRLDAHMERGNALMERVAEEHRLNREAYDQGLDLLARVVDGNARAMADFTQELGRLGRRIDAFGERIDAFGERIDSFGERVDAFGATLELQREILLRFLDRLDEGGAPPQG